MKKPKNPTPSVNPRRPGRPPTGGDLTRRITVTIRESQIEALDAIAEREDITRSEALRRLIDVVLY